MWSTRCECFSPDAFVRTKVTLHDGCWKTHPTVDGLRSNVISTGTFPIFFRKLRKGGITGSASIGVFSQPWNKLHNFTLSSVFVWAAIGSSHYVITAGLHGCFWLWRLRTWAPVPMDMTIIKEKHVCVFSEGKNCFYTYIYIYIYIYVVKYIHCFYSSRHMHRSCFHLWTLLKNMLVGFVTKMPVTCEFASGFSPSSKAPFVPVLAKTFSLQAHDIATVLVPWSGKNQALFRLNQRELKFFRKILRIKVLEENPGVRLKGALPKLSTASH